LKCLVAILVIICTASIAFAKDTPQKFSGRSEQRVIPSCYPYLLDVKSNPNYKRRPFAVPGWDTFNNQTQFCALRSLNDGSWRDDLNLYVDKYKLGRVIWPVIYCLFSPQIGDMVDEIKKRDLYLFNLWGYVPGSSTVAEWSNVTPPPGLTKHIEEKLGDHFLGLDNGEQDGRYIGGYSPQQCPSFNNRYMQYLNFQRHFERLGNDLDNHLSALVSLCYGHYLIKEGNHALIGAETAQGLPNSQVYYSFIRGAGKQYGVHWFGNASVFNRWGWKSYDTTQSDGGYKSGPEEGTSLRLLKRLLYTHILYNSVAVGFENGWLIHKTNTGNYVDQFELTPIGKIQAEGVKWIEKYGQPGVMHTSTAFLMDFYSGWAMPRHLYTGNIYQVWGGMPYESGDYLTHSLLSLAYPGYEDSSYYHNEKGFLAPTPFGDTVDCLLSDASENVLRQYPLIIAAGHLAKNDPELAGKLRKYVELGGELVLTSANVVDGLLPEVKIGNSYTEFPSGTKVTWNDSTVQKEDLPFRLTNITAPNAAVLARCGKTPTVVRLLVGKGHITLLASEYGLAATGAKYQADVAQIDHPLVQPYALLKQAQKAFGDAMNAQRLFEVGEGLGLVTCRRAKGEYTLGVYNNNLTVKPFKIRSFIGNITSIEELKIEDVEHGEKGCWPKGFSGEDTNEAGKISGGDIRIFRVKVNEQNLHLLPAPEPESAPEGKYLTIRSDCSIKEAILSRPTFFNNYCGVKVDYHYFSSRSMQEIETESIWIKMQKLKVIVDFTSGLNLYPDLVLLNDYLPPYDKTRQIFSDVFSKMGAIGSDSIIVSIHRLQETRANPENAKKQFVEELQWMCKSGYNVYLQHHPYRPIGSNGWQSVTAEIGELNWFISQVDRPNIKMALNLGHMDPAKDNSEKMADTLKDKLGMVLLSSSTTDAYNQSYDSHSPAALHWKKMPWLKNLGVPVIFDADYKSTSEEYEDLKLLGN